MDTRFGRQGACKLCIFITENGTNYRYCFTVWRWREFRVILPDIDMKGAGDFAERLRETISKLKIEDKEKNICAVLTISIGTSSFTENTAQYNGAPIHQADMALYEAKRLGRDSVCCLQSLLQGGAPVSWRRLAIRDFVAALKFYTSSYSRAHRGNEKEQKHRPLWGVKVTPYSRFQLEVVVKGYFSSPYGSRKDAAIHVFSVFKFLIF